RYVVNRAENVGGILNVANGEQFVTLRGGEFRTRIERFEEVRVISAAGDGLFKNGGIGGHAAQSIFINEALEVAAGEQIAANVIEPDGLAVFDKFLERIFCFDAYAISDGLCSH